MRETIGALPKALALAACSLSLLVPVAFAAAVTGGNYRGTTTARTVVKFRVSGNGKRLASYTFNATTTCSNGESGTVFFRNARNAPVIHISSNSFSVLYTLRATIFDQATRKNVKGKYTDSVTGRFDSNRNATGTVRIRFRSRNGRLLCDSGALNYTAHAA